MANETEFARIKRAVENEKNNKMQAIAKMESISDEKERIFKEVNEVTGKQFTSAEEVEAYTNELKAEIESKVKEMGDILKAEGVAY